MGAELDAGDSLEKKARKALARKLHEPEGPENCRPLEEGKLVHEELPEEDAIAPEKLARPVLDQLGLVDGVLIQAPEVEKCASCPDEAGPLPSGRPLSEGACGGRSSARPG